MALKRCGATYAIVDKDLALLLALGLDDADGSDGVERGDAKLLFRVHLGLALLEEGADALVLDLLGGDGTALGFLGLGDAVGVGALGAALAAFASTLGRGVFVLHGARTAGRHRVGLVSGCATGFVVLNWLCAARVGGGPEAIGWTWGNFFGGGTDKWR